MRSFFSTLLLLNWGLLILLLAIALGIMFLKDFTIPILHPVLYFLFVLLAIYGTFYMSSAVAKRVVDPLSLLEEKTREINAGDFGAELSYPDIRELAQLTMSINEMATRLKNQFLDLTVEKEKFNSLLQNLKEGVFAIDSNGKILFQNRNIPFALVAPGSQALDFTKAIIHKGLLNFIKTQMKEKSEGKIEFEMGYHEYSVRFYPIQNNGIVYLFVGVVSEITEDRQYERIREQFFQNASHELKTPITSIKGYAETLEIKLQLSEDSGEKKFLNAILRNTERMIRIVEDMLTVTKLEQHTTICQPEEFKIYELVRNIGDSVGVLISRKNQELIIDIDPKLEVYADLVLMEHLLINLISNASSYSPESTSILVRVKELEKFYLLEVADQGIGISPEDRERIFERFFRVDSNRSRKEGGTGLGLSIVKHIAKLHKGKVEVNSNPGGGSIFAIEFPKKAYLPT